MTSFNKSIQLAIQGLSSPSSHLKFLSALRMVAIVKHKKFQENVIASV